MMRVEMTFDDAAIAAAGYSRRTVYDFVKKAFGKHGLPCVSEDDTLAFGDTGHKDDYAQIWNMITKLMVADWFQRCATSLTFIEDSYVEDVLSQAWKLNGHDAPDEEKEQPQGRRKQIELTLNRKSLASCYPKPEGAIKPNIYEMADKDIERFMERNGFERWHGVFYNSKERITDFDISLLIEKMDAALPWLVNCVETFDAATIGKIRSYTNLLDVGTIPEENEEYEF